MQKYYLQTIHTDVLSCTEEIVYLCVCVYLGTHVVGNTESEVALDAVHAVAVLLTCCAQVLL